MISYKGKQYLVKNDAVVIPEMDLVGLNQIDGLFEIKN